MNTDSKDEFCFERARATADLEGPEDALWPVNAYSDADELNDLLEAAQNAGLIAAQSQARLFVYPLSIGEPDPLLAIVVVGGPALLGPELELSERDGEDPIAFTLRLLEQVVDQGNAALAGWLADSVALDRIATYLNRPGPRIEADLYELVAKELQGSGRAVLDNAED